MSRTAVRVIANPASGRGSGARRLPAFRDALAAVGITDIALTTRPGEEHDLALAAARDGAETIVALGGDGTWSNTARGLLASGRDVRLVLAEAGTGNDLAFAAGLDAREPAQVARIAAAAGERRIDVGEVEGIHFLTVCGFGFDADVLASLARVRGLTGPLVYKIAALMRLFRYPGEPIGLAVDGETVFERAPRLGLVISNGRRYGGGFLINPQAEIDDGRFDACVIGNASPLRRLALFGRARDGTHVGEGEILTCSGRHMTLSFVAPPAFQTDGELHRAASPRVDVTCLSGRLRLGAPIP